MLAVLIVDENELPSNVNDDVSAMLLCCPLGEN